MRAKGLVLAGLLAAGVLGTAGKADAQFGLNLGYNNPYYGGLYNNAFNSAAFGAYNPYYGYSPFVSYPGLGYGTGIPSYYNTAYSFYSPYGGRSFYRYNYYNPGFGPGVYNYRFGRFR